MTPRIHTNRAPMDGPNLPADWSPNDPHPWREIAGTLAVLVAACALGWAVAVLF